MCFIDMPWLEGAGLYVGDVGEASDEDLVPGVDRRPHAVAATVQRRPAPLCHVVTVTDVCITLGFVYRSAAVDGFGKPGKSAAAAAITLTTQGEMCI